MQTQTQVQLKEMSRLLGKIRAMRSGNGDVFFVGLARVFMAQCQIPFNNEPIYVADGDRGVYLSSPVKMQSATGGGVRINR